MKHILAFAFLALAFLSVTGPYKFLVEPPITIDQVFKQGSKYEETMDSSDLKELQRLIEKYNSQHKDDGWIVDFMFQGSHLHFGE